LKDGGYAWWAPEDVTDREMLEPSLALLHDYPTIICSGNYTPNDPQDVTYQVLRVRIITTYEFTTTQQGYPMQSACCLSVELENIMRSLSHIPWASANEEHKNLIERAWATVVNAVRRSYKFYNDNSAVINSLAAGMGKLALTAI